VQKLAQFKPSVLGGPGAASRVLIADRMPAFRFSCGGAGKRGFTLVELAVTLFIVTLLIGGVIIPLQTQVESRKVEETQRLLEQAREALLGYASAFGYFPCPADATSNGQEPPSPPVDHPNGICPSYYGFLPAALLGFTPVDAQGYGIDPWGSGPANRIRYAVASQSVGGITLPFTRTGGMLSAGIASIGSANDLLYVCGSGAGVTAGTNCGTAQTLASNAVVVIWSVGPNATTGGASVHELENPNPVSGSQDRIFVSRVRSTSGANEFDDALTWIPAFVVVSRLVATGQLP
jgi:prepilin-type N-terminal cleavage/methylation domain-containing protein